MKTEVQNEITDFVGYLESSGKLTSTDSQKIKKFLDSDLKNQEEKKKGNDLPSLLTREEVAKLLKVSTKTVSRLSDAGVLKRHRVGQKAYRYLKSEILTHIGIESCR